MQLTFSNKVVLITGGTSGIGLSTARLLLDAGARVLITGRNAERGKLALTELGQNKERLEFLQADVSKVPDCQRSIDKVVVLFGKLDVVVNSAGIYMASPIERVS